MQSEALNIIDWAGCAAQVKQHVEKPYENKVCISMVLCIIAGILLPLKGTSVEWINGALFVLAIFSVFSYHGYHWLRKGTQVSVFEQVSLRRNETLIPIDLIEVRTRPFERPQMVLTVPPHFGGSLTYNFSAVSDTFTAEEDTFVYRLFLEDNTGFELVFSDLKAGENVLPFMQALSGAKPK